jgi:hypothetical protein
MGAVVNMQAFRDTQVTGTADVAKLALIVRILSINAGRNNAQQRAKLAAAQRLLGGKA